MRPIDVFFKISAIDFFCFQWPIIKNIEYLEFLRLIWVFAKLGNITTFLNLQCCTTMQNYKKIIRLDSINDHLHKVLNPIWVRMIFKLFLLVQLFVWAFVRLFFSLFFTLLPGLFVCLFKFFVIPTSGGREGLLLSFVLIFTFLF